MDYWYLGSIFRHTLTGVTIGYYPDHTMASSRTNFVSEYSSGRTHSLRRAQVLELRKVFGAVGQVTPLLGPRSALKMPRGDDGKASEGLSSGAG